MSESENRGPGSFQEYLNAQRGRQQGRSASEKKDPGQPVSHDDDYSLPDFSEEVRQQPPSRPSRSVTSSQQPTPPRPSQGRSVPDPTPSVPSRDVRARVEQEYPEQQGRYANDSFERVEDGHVSYDDEYEEEYVEEAPAPPPPPRQVEQPRQRPRGRRRQRQEEPPTPREAQFSNFIDEDTGALLPYGGEKTKVSNVGEYDRREDMQKRARTYRTIVLALLVAIVLGAAVQIIRPKESLSPDEVRAIAADDRGDTGFPREDGAGFAKDFVQTYLTHDENNPQSLRALQYFYSGVSPNQEGGDSSDLARGFGTAAKQTIVTGPSIYEVEVITPYSARYTVGAVTKLADTTKPANEDGTDSTLVFLSVSVYYDKKRDNFSVTSDSPTVVPPMTVGSREEIPEEKPIGEEVEPDTVPGVPQLVQQFMKAYGESSDIDHSAVDQYVVNPNDPSVTRGLGGSMKLEGEEDLESAVEMVIYNENQDLNTLYVDTRVNWMTAGEGRTNDNSAIIPSRYVITLTKQGDRYLVERILPKYYISDEAAKQNQGESVEE